MDISLVGLNHRTADVSIRECFALSDACSPEKWAIPLEGAIRESFILSTCNRVEILAVGTCADVCPEVAEKWASRCGKKREALEPHLYILQGKEAVRHVFSVASSLDSMVLGEPQILGQMKEAYRMAVDAGTAGILINRLMHKSFYVAKRVRTETGVAASAVSISYAAVELAKRIFGDMRKAKAMLVGAGEMAELAAMHLVQAGIESIIIANRTFANAEELAEKLHGRAVPLEAMDDMLAQADIVITSTGSSEPVIRAQKIREILKKRRNKPMFFIDIAVPRDVDTEVNTLDNVYVYDIDDLKEIVEENMQQRQEEAQKAHTIVEEECEAFFRWHESLKLQPTIVELIRRHEAYAEEELAKTLRRLGKRADPELTETLRTMLSALVRKIDHDPISFLKGNHHEDEQNRARLLDVARRLFALDK